MTFKDYYQSLTDKKKSLLIERLTKATGKTYATVYRWMNQKAKASKLDKAKVAQITGVPVVELFPEEVEV